METASLSLEATNSEKNKKLMLEYKSLEMDHKIFKDSGKYFDSRRFSMSDPNPIIQIFEKSPRALMSSLQDRGGPIERGTIESKGRCLLGEFEDAARVSRSCGDGEIEDCGSGKQGSWSGSCEKLEVDFERGRYEWGFNGVFVGLMVVIIGFVYIICNGGVYGDEEVMLLPT